MVIYHTRQHVAAGAVNRLVNRNGRFGIMAFKYFVDAVIVNNERAHKLAAFVYDSSILNLSSEVHKSIFNNVPMR